MTSKELLDYALVELNKREAPSLLLDDYNYFINKAINQYINKMYNTYDVNQQKSDDLRVLKSTAILTPFKSTDYGTSPMYSNIYEVTLPNNYLHILNCTVEFKNVVKYKCSAINSLSYRVAKRLTADQASQIINNYYYKPSYKQPYYYIHNVNISLTEDTQTPIDNYPKESGERYGNSQEVRMEIRYGSDGSIYVPNNIYVDYLKTPQFIRLTQDQVDELEDNSQILEFPDYVCQEILNELIRLLMENSSDPRLQSHIPINQSIAAQGQQSQSR